MSDACKVAPLNTLRAQDRVLNDDVLPRIYKFLLDKRTGNIKLNVRDGMILGMAVEELSHFKP